jgi:hypothetical protein
MDGRSRGGLARIRFGAARRLGFGTSQFGYATPRSEPASQTKSPGLSGTGTKSHCPLCRLHAHRVSTLRTLFTAINAMSATVGLRQ